MRPPRGWPKGMAWTDNAAFNGWRPRPSSMFRLLQCAHFTTVEPSQFSILTPDQLDKIEEGTRTHVAFAANKLKNPEVVMPFVGENHEVQLGYDLREREAIIPFWGDDNDRFRRHAESRAYIIGSTDYLRVYEEDGLRYRVVLDLKTAKNVKTEYFFQAKAYHRMHEAEVDEESTYVWHKRARTDQVYKPSWVGYTETQLGKVVGDVFEKVRALLFEGPSDLTKPRPGDMCAFCPARYECDAYYDGYVMKQPGPLKNYLIKELTAYDKSV